MSGDARAEADDERARDGDGAAAAELFARAAEAWDEALAVLDEAEDQDRAEENRRLIRETRGRSIGPT